MIESSCGPCKWVTKHPLARPVESAEVAANRELMRSTKFPIIEDTKDYADCMRTTFMKDFPNWLSHGRPPPARPPPLGTILNKDDRCLARVGTDTRINFNLSGYDKPEIVDGYIKYFGTNFRLQEDLRTGSYESTSGSCHRKLPVEIYPDDFDRKALWRSSILRGDRTHLVPGVSHYRQSFQEGAKTKPPLLGGYVSGPTITGDLRSNDYVTTERDAYRKFPQTRTPPIPPPKAADVWQGNQVAGYKQSTFQLDYPPLDNAQCFLDDKRHHAANRFRNLHASYVYHDGAKCLDRYQNSMAKKDFPSLIREPEQSKLSADFHTQSHLVFGDTERENGTTQKSSYRNDFDRKLIQRPLVVDPFVEECKQQKSHVSLGDRAVREYDTTTADYAAPDLTKLGENQPHHDLQASSIPLKLYPRTDDISSVYVQDFRNRDQCKMKLNDDRLRQMKATNLHEHRDLSFQMDSSEYADCFVKKKGTGVADVRETIRRNRRSSVPLGTLSQF